MKEMDICRQCKSYCDSCRLQTFCGKWAQPRAQKKERKGKPWGNSARHKTVHCWKVLQSISAAAVTGSTTQGLHGHWHASTDNTSNLHSVSVKQQRWKKNFSFPASSSLPKVRSNSQSTDFPIPYVSRESSSKQLTGASPAGSELVWANRRVYDLIVQCSFSSERNRSGFELQVQAFISFGDLQYPWIY